MLFIILHVAYCKYKIQINSLLAKIGILAILVMLGISNGSAIEIERFEHLDSRDGLSQNSVLAIYCDHKGYIWLGTMDGLNRHDGYTFRLEASIPAT